MKEYWSILIMILCVILFICIYKFVPLPKFIAGSKPYNKIRIFFLFVFLFFLLILFAFIFYIQNYGVSDELVKDRLFNLKTENVNYIKITPVTRYEIILGQKPVIIDSIIKIRKFIEEIKKMQHWEPNHPFCTWMVFIELNNKNDENVEMEVGFSETNGVIIYIYKDGPWGGSIPVEQYRNDRLGPLIENEFKKE